MISFSAITSRKYFINQNSRGWKRTFAVSGRRRVYRHSMRRDHDGGDLTFVCENIIVTAAKPLISTAYKQKPAIHKPE